MGKKSTSSGLQEGIIVPSKLWLNAFCFVCDSVILVEASDKSFKESMTLFMPKDKLNLQFDVRGTVTISNEEANVAKIFEKITSQKTDNARINLISFEPVYATYAQPVIRSVTRAIMTK